MLLPYGGTRLLNVINGMDWKAIDGDKEGMADIRDDKNKSWKDSYFRKR
jgi:hypothetical protein